MALVDGALQRRSGVAAHLVTGSQRVSAGVRSVLQSCSNLLQLCGEKAEKGVKRRQSCSKLLQLCGGGGNYYNSAVGGVGTEIRRLAGY